MWKYDMTALYASTPLIGESSKKFISCRFFLAKINCLLDVGEARKVQKDWVEGGFTYIESVKLQVYSLDGV